MRITGIFVTLVVVGCAPAPLNAMSGSAPNLRIAEMMLEAQQAAALGRAATKVAEALKKYGIEVDKPAPWTV